MSVASPEVHKQSLIFFCIQTEVQYVQELLSTLCTGPGITIQAELHRTRRLTVVLNCVRSKGVACIAKPSSPEKVKVYMWLQVQVFTTAEPVRTSSKKNWCKRGVCWIFTALFQIDNPNQCVTADTWFFSVTMKAAWKYAYNHYKDWSYLQEAMFEEVEWSQKPVKPFWKVKCVGWQNQRPLYRIQCE